ncbi:type VI secretion system-associated FHA domain protein TagH [Collimonas sp.]|jgi:FHA domain-containing protein|uniref:type VI secretion system-associated FHA domain protein TagH n=1 Tax=Collimonas sp. TaxID=1963772 RepID=UPI002B545253|nr:type VI secretion system-associated FHA domain protein TagH [Collimonas sp.]HWW05772.1 type VI secretion system-associated FHA domain protein TagH [Collimonas sp.]
MIKISVVSYNNVAPELPLSAVFGREPKTLGRSEENYFVLADPRNFVSRTQAAIKSDGVRQTITNLSRANPILLNGHEIDAEREYDLQIGDEIQIGLYLLRAEAQLNLMKENPDMINQPGQAAANSARRPNASKQPSKQPLMSVSETRLAALAQLNLELAATANAALPTSLQASATPARPVSAAQNTAATPAPAAVTVSAGDDSHQAAVPSASSEALVQAFIKGAGLPAGTLAAELTPELMETVGKLLATAVQGTIDLNATRALVKKEAHADVTKVVVRNNNPLKFFADSQTVLIQMLRKKMPGFMGATEAMQDAYQDLQAHQAGVVSGMRATMNETLQRFNPEVMEKRLKKGGMLDALLPSSRKAKLWDAYAERYQRIIAESSQDDFQTLFGKAFLLAYERKVEKLRKETPHA